MFLFRLFKSLYHGQVNVWIEAVVFPSIGLHGSILQLIESLGEVEHLEGALYLLLIPLHEGHQELYVFFAIWQDLDGFWHLLQWDVEEGRVEQDVLKLVLERLRVLQVKVVEPWEVFEALIDIADCYLKAVSVIESFR